MLRARLNLLEECGHVMDDADFTALIGVFALPRRLHVGHLNARNNLPRLYLKVGRRPSRAPPRVARAGC